MSSACAGASPCLRFSPSGLESAPPTAARMGRAHSGALVDSGTSSSATRLRDLRPGAVLKAPDRSVAPRMKQRSTGGCSMPVRRSGRCNPPFRRNLQRARAIPEPVSSANPTTSSPSGRARVRTRRGCPGCARGASASDRRPGPGAPLPGELPRRPPVQTAAAMKRVRGAEGPEGRRVHLERAHDVDPLHPGRCRERDGTGDEGHRGPRASLPSAIAKPAAARLVREVADGSTCSRVGRP